MGIQSSINSALGTLRVLGALKTGKNYIDQQVQKGAKSLEKATGEVKDTVKESAKYIRTAMNTWIDKDGNEFFGKVPTAEEDLEWEKEAQEEQAKYQEEIDEQYRLANAYRVRVAYDAVADKLISKQTARDNVNKMKNILKGNITFPDLMAQNFGTKEEKNLNGGAN